MNFKSLAEPQKHLYMRLSYNFLKLKLEQFTNALVGYVHDLIVPRGYTEHWLTTRLRQTKKQQNKGWCQQVASVTKRHQVLAEWGLPQNACCATRRAGGARKGKTDFGSWRAVTVGEHLAL